MPRIGGPLREKAAPDAPEGRAGPRAATRTARPEPPGDGRRRALARAAGVLAFAGMEDPRRVCSKCGNRYAPDVIFCPKDGTPLGTKKTEVVDDPYVGLVVQGQFTIEQLIGIGAMGRVYRAHQTGIERQVAIKILHRELLRNPTVMARFHREAKVASRLTHPNVVQILMTGSLPRESANVGGEAYLVMEHLDGISLRSALGASGGALPLPRALHIILQVCDAVGEAHAQGIVHRDLKPENVMLVRRGDDKDFVKVLDFGVARIEWADSTVATQAGSIFGTARYISPEGAQGEPVGPPSDVYSIATMLYQCLAGTTPFDGDSPVAILVKQTSEAAPELRSLARSSYVPEPIAAVVQENLVKPPGDRCSDARALGRALVEAARHGGLSPDDLVVRSTLLANANALKLQSIERTRALKLSPELAQRLHESPKGAGQTAWLEQPEPDSTAVAAESRSASASKSEAEPGLAPASAPLEPTLTDEPVASGADEARGAAAPSSPGDSVAHAAPRSSVDDSGDQAPRGSHPDTGQWLPEASDGRARRIAVIATCFAFGAAIAVAAALQLGVFDRRASNLEWYVERARAAAAASAWRDPPGESVRDITDAALARWPNSEPILKLRRDSADVLVREAEGLGAAQRDDALSRVRIAVELDPLNARAKALAETLLAPTPVAEQPAAVDARPIPDDGANAVPEAPHGKKRRKRRAPKPPERAPQTPPETPATDTPEPSAPAPPEGRWL